MQQVAFCFWNDAEKKKKKRQDAVLKRWNLILDATRSFSLFVSSVKMPSGCYLEAARRLLTTLRKTQSLVDTARMLCSH